MDTNPLLQPYEIPPLDKIKPEHFVPAIEHAIVEAKEKFRALKSDKAPPTFENTIVPLSRLFDNLNRIQYLAYLLKVSEQTQEHADIENMVSDKIDTFEKTVFQDQTLARRFQTVGKPSAEEDQTLYKDFWHKFEKNGLFLSPAGQKRLKEIDDRLRDLCKEFNINLSKSAYHQAIAVTREELQGLSEGDISAFRENAAALDNVIVVSSPWPRREAPFDDEVQKARSTGYLFVPERFLVDRLLETAENRDFRKRIYEALNRVGTQPPYDNEPITKEIQSLRQERVRLLDPEKYLNFAAYTLSQTMAGTVPRARELLEEVGKKALPKFEQTVRTIQAFARERGGPRMLEPWDLPYWANRYKKEVYHFDSQKLSEYLSLNNVIEGFFSTASRVFGVTFQENKTHPRLHPDVRAYDVIDSKTKEHIGVFYADFFLRDNKRDDAWMQVIQEKSPGHPPIAQLNTNFLKPTEAHQTLLSFEEVRTLFHEGSHVLHGLLGTHTRHASLQGPSRSLDYNEFLAIIMENWPEQAECLNSFARHYKDQSPVPADLLEAAVRSNRFMRESYILKLAQNGLRDMAYHSADPKQYTTSQEVAASADFQHPLADHIRPYPINRWHHLFTGWGAQYYGYTWSEALAAQGFEPFRKNGIYDPQACERLTQFYSYGCSRDKNRAFEEFCGQPVTPERLADALAQSIGANQPSRVTLASDRTGRQ